jgi:alpha-beta hydrolase superfamily lysophospholipase
MRLLATATAYGPQWIPWLVAVGGFATGLIGCLVMAVSEWGAWALVLPGRRLENGNTAADPSIGSPIEITAPDGVRLAGLWHAADLPTGRTVVLLHGFADFTSLRQRIEVLTRHGWNVATLDARAHGRSGGDRGSFGGREAADLRAWIDALTERVGPSLALTAWGRSMGAGIAIRSAVADPRIRALVFEAPYVDLDDAIVAALKGYRVPFARFLARRISRRAARLAGVSLTRPRPIDLAPEVRVPVLIVHGANDWLIPLAEAKRLAATVTPPAEVVEVPNAGHANAIDVGGVPLIEQIAGFLDRAVPR